jgi:RNA polymerase sigma-70 factor (sigma-E family)
MTSTGPPRPAGGHQASAPTPGQPAPETITQAAQVTAPPPDAADWADQAVIAVYRTHYGSLVRQAARLVRDIPTAEDVVQDSFIAMHITRPRLEDRAEVLPYLRQCVVNRSRSVLRHRVVVDQHPLAPVPDMPSAEESALTRLGHSATISALNLLAPRQRQVLTLRFFADMSEAQIAAALGISKGTVKTHTSRGLTSLRPALEPRA